MCVLFSGVGCGGILAFQIPLPRFHQLSSLLEEVCAVIGKSARIGIFAIGIRRPCQRRRVEVLSGSQMIDKRLELRLVHALDSVEKPRGIDK